MTETETHIVESTHPDAGYKVEHILISATIVHTRGIGKFDDLCASQMAEGMRGYEGVLLVDTEVHYKHGKEEAHIKDCGCWLCEQARYNDSATGGEIQHSS